MPWLSHYDVKQILAKDSQSLHNDAFRERFEKATAFESIQFDTLDSFLKLVWHFSPYSRVLTPPRWWGGGRVYTVGAVAKRMIANEWTFKDFVNRRVDGVYKPEWFESCLKIDEGFSWDKCLPLMLLKTDWQQKLDCPGSSYRAIDGIHRSLVIAHKVLKGELSYRPVNGIVMRYD